MKKLLTALLSLTLVALPLSVFAQSAGSYPATLSFSGVANNQVAAGQNFTVDVLFNTGGVASSGADVIVEYDSSEASFVSATFPSATGIYPLVITDPPIQKTSGTTRILEMARSQSGGGTPTTGAGTFVKLTFSPLSVVGDTITLNFDFDGVGATVDSNITSATAVADLLGTATPITLTVVNGVTNAPIINSISPTNGNKDISQNVTIYGANFGATQGSGWVHIGTKTATVVSWSDTQIVVTIPSEPTLTQNSTRQMKVHRQDGQEANYTGYTYTVVPLPNSGPEEVMWASIVLVALGLSIFTYRKLYLVSSTPAAFTTPELSQLMSPQADSDNEDNISYRF